LKREGLREVRDLRGGGGGGKKGRPGSITGFP